MHPTGVAKHHYGYGNRDLNQCGFLYPLLARNGEIMRSDMRLRDIVSIAIWLVLLTSMSPIMWAAPAFAQEPCESCDANSDCEAACMDSSGKTRACRNFTCNGLCSLVCQGMPRCSMSCVVQGGNDSTCGAQPPPNDPNDMCIVVGMCNDVCDGTVICSTPCDRPNMEETTCANIPNGCLPSSNPQECGVVCRDRPVCSTPCQLSGIDSTCKAERNCQPDNNILLFPARKTRATEPPDPFDTKRQPIIFEDGDIAVISSTSNGRGAIVIDNFMTINGVNVCEGAVGQQFSDSCFGAIIQNPPLGGVGKPIENILTPIPPIDVSGFIPKKGKQVLEVELRDLGVIGGNTDLYLVTTAKLPEIVTRRFAADPPKGSCENGPCGPGDTFTITANFTTKSDALPVRCEDFFVNVRELSGNNKLLNADNGPAGAGAILTPTLPTAACADRLLQPGESFPITFQIRLHTTDRFRFVIDLIGLLR